MKSMTLASAATSSRHPGAPHRRGLNTLNTFPKRPCREQKQGHACTHLSMRPQILTAVPSPFLDATGHDHHTAPLLAPTLVLMLQHVHVP